MFLPGAGASAAQEIFKSLKDADSESVPRPASVLKLMQRISPKKTKCDCGQYIGSDWKFCPHCSVPNASYDEKKAELMRTGHRRGWRTAPEPEISPEAAAEGEDPDQPDHAGMLMQLDDLMKELRQRGKRKRAAQDDEEHVQSKRFQSHKSVSIH